VQRAASSLEMFAAFRDDAVLGATDLVFCVWEGVGCDAHARHAAHEGARGLACGCVLPLALVILQTCT
jgi:hypothetical protein